MMAFGLFQRAVIPFERRRGQSRIKHFLIGCLNGGLVAISVALALTLVSPLPEPGDEVAAGGLAQGAQPGPVKPKIPLAGLAESSGRVLALAEDQVAELIARYRDPANAPVMTADAGSQPGVEIETEPSLEVAAALPEAQPVAEQTASATPDLTVGDEPAGPSVIITTGVNDRDLTRQTGSGPDRPDPSNGQVLTSATETLNSPRAPESYRPAGVTPPRLAAEDPIRIEVPSAAITAALAPSAPDDRTEAVAAAQATAPVDAAALTIDEPVVRVRASSTAEPGALPLLAVVLDDVGASALTEEMLNAAPVPVGLGVVPGSSRAEEIASIAARTGHEIVAQIALGGATEGAHSAALSPDATADEMLVQVSSLPMAVAVASLDQAITAQSSQMARALLTSLDTAGLGFIERRSGPKGTAARLADELGTGYAAATRAIPPEASADFMYRALNTAARDARLSGAVIVTGPANQRMLETLLRWGLERGGRSATLVPISTVLARPAG